MSRKIQLDLDEIERTYRLLNAVSKFLHQPLNHDITYEFAQKYYQEIANVYYDIVRNWVPDDVRQRLTEE